jgi:Leucine-rich repeat (LRR) protein
MLTRMTRLGLGRHAVRLSARRPYSISFRGHGLERVPRLAPGVTDLDLSENHIREIDGDIPDSVTRLGLSYNPLTSVRNLPRNLRNLDLGYCPITGIPQLPDGISTLCLYGIDRVRKIDNIPANVKWLGIYGKLIERIEGLPTALEELYFGDLPARKITKLENLPSTLQRLHVVWQSIKRIENLPDGLRYLSLFQNEITTMEGIPDSVEVVELTGNDVRRIRAIPKSCRKLFLTGVHKYKEDQLDQMREVLARGDTMTIKDTTLSYSSPDALIGRSD